MNGYEVKATNGNSIFLPAAGYRFDGVLFNAGSYGGYWSSSLDTDNPSLTQSVSFYSDYHSTSRDYRYYGQSVRAVSKVGEVIAPCYSVSLAGTENGTISVNSTLAQAGETVTLKITPNTGYKLKSLSVMCGENEVEVTDNSFIMPEGEVKVTASFVLVSGTENGYTWIDLGLSVRWATMNVGATAPEEYAITMLGARLLRKPLTIGQLTSMPMEVLLLLRNIAVMQVMAKMFLVMD